MRTVFVGAGACFANIMTDIIARTVKYKDKDPMWKLLAEVLRYEGDREGGKYEAYYFDSGPELSREERKGDIFTYNIAIGNLLSGAGNIKTAIEFWNDKGDKQFRKMRYDIGEPKGDLFISIRGCGATNCGSGFLLDRAILEEFENALIIQFLILPHRGEGIESSRVVFAISQVVELLKKYPDRYTCVLISNERILKAAKSFEAMGQNWFYPIANQVVADIIARILYPTFFEHFRHIIEKDLRKTDDRALGVGSREKYLDVRDFVRQPGLRTVEFAHALDVKDMEEEEMANLVAKMGEEIFLKQYEGGDPMIFGSLGKMEHTTAVFSMLMGPRGEVGDMTKIVLAEALEETYMGAFPKVYIYDILNRGYELLVFPSGGIPEDVERWSKKFVRKLKNPRYAQVVQQYTMGLNEVIRLYALLAEFLQYDKPELDIKKAGC